MAEQNFKVKKGLDVAEDASIGGALSADSATITGTVTANAFVGDGSSLTGITSYVESDFSADFANKTTSDLTEGSNLYFTTGRADSAFDARFDSSFDERLATKSTANLSEGGSNLYYTTTRFDSDLGASSTSDLSEGSNLYYTTARVDSDFDIRLATKSTSDVAEGTNLYYTTARFDSDLGASTTTDLSEGTNLYYTTARADSDFDARLTGGTGVSVSSGTVSIGQSVGTTDNVTFADITADTVKSLNYLEFDGTAPSYAEGRLWYDSANGALAMYGDEADITLQIGQEHYLRVYNNTGSTITDGTPVYLTGVNNEFPTVAPADASDADKYSVAGLATHNIEDASYGYITVNGVLHGLNTSGLTAGQFVFLGTSPGTLTSTAPSYPNFPFCIGFVLASDSADGEIAVSLQTHTLPSLVTAGNAYVGNDLTIGGDLTVLGSQSTIAVSSLAVDDQFIYLQSGDIIGDNTTFTGSGLNDAYVSGNFEGTSTTNYYVRIDSVGDQDTFEWSKDNFTTTEATGVVISADTPVALDNGFSIKFTAQTGHTLNDTWTWVGTATSLDFGIVSHYTDSSGYHHAGWFRDNADGRFKIFKNYSPEVSTSVDTTHASYQKADLELNRLYGNVTGAVTGNVTGNASTATALASSRTFSISGDITASGVTFNGTGNVALSAAITAGSIVNADINASAAIADTKLATISTSGKVLNSATTATNANTASAIVARDASGNFSAGTITASLTGNVTGNVSGSSGSTTGNAATATKLQTARTIGGVSFDGTANINLPGVNTAGTQNTSGTAALATSVTVTANNATNETTYITFVDGKTGSQGIETDSDFTYNPSTNTLTAGTFVGALTGNVTGNVSGSSGSTTGNAATATKLATARTIAGVSFDGSANISLSTSNITEGTRLYYTTTRFDSDFGTQTTSDLSEGTNLYYTTARSRSAVSVTDAGGYGSLAYNSGTGVITYTGPSDADIRGRISATGDISYNSSTGVISFSETYSTASELLTALKTVDGATSGLDADLLDGQHGSYYRINVYDATNTLLN